MNLSKPIETLWYENAAGDKWVPKLDGDKHPEDGLPEGFVYQHSMFPTRLRHSILKIVQPSEVAACDHPSDHIRPTGGWVDGIKGRECRACNGTQVIEDDKDWPEKWDAEGSRSILSGSCGYSDELALALCTAKEVAGNLKLPHPLRLSQAIMIAVTACERCMNSLAHAVGLDWGYPEFSEDWQKCGTSCDLCEDEVDQSVPDNQVG